LFCTIYFADIGTFIGDPPPPLADDDEDIILEVMASQGPQVQIPDGMHRRLDTRFRLELGDQISALLTKVGVFPALMRDIKAYPMLLELCMEMSHDLMHLMCHIIVVSRILAVKRALDDRHNSSSSITHSSSTHKLMRVVVIILLHILPLLLHLT
jgi:hypothetical protein